MTMKRFFVEINLSGLSAAHIIQKISDIKAFAKNWQKS